MAEPATGFDPANINYRALVDPVTAEQLAAFRADRTRGTMPADNLTLRRSVIRLGVNVIILAVCLAPLLMLAAAIGQTAVTYLAELTVVRFSILLVGTIPALWFAHQLRTKVRLYVPWSRWFRLSQFARDNGLQYVPESSRPDLPGAIFTSTAPGLATDRFISEKGNHLEFGTFEPARGEFTLGTAKWGYLAMQLDRELPHMVLQARANTRKNRALTDGVLRNQVLSLEGDFNSHFTLYAPRAYERDALYVFAPDLMAVMIDEAKYFDVEIVGRWIFFYQPHGFDPTSRQTLETLFRITRIVGTKTSRQTQRYWDGRGGSFAANRVGAFGRRLQVRDAMVVLGILGLIFAITRIFM